MKITSKSFSERDYGGPAFPHVVYSSNVYPNGKNSLPEFGSQSNEGMTLRDYFAAKALTVIAAAGGIDHIGPAECASGAYEIADAMLAERAK